MKTGSVIAFPEEHFRGKNLGGLQTARLRVNGKVCICVPLSSLNEVCEILGVSKQEVSQVGTDYQHVYLAKISQNGRAKASEKDVQENQNDILRRKYMELCGYNRKASQVETLRSVVTKLQANIEQNQEQLVVSLRELEEKQQALQVILGTDDSSLAHFGDEFDRLLKHPDLEKLEIAKNTIVIYTKPISIDYRRVVYAIGRFKITIYTDGSHGGVRMTNLTRVLDGYHHPHINTGVPCLGNITEAIPHMIAEHKYAAVIAVCIQYLKSYENSDTYRPYMDIEDWPIQKGGKRNEND